MTVPADGTLGGWVEVEVKDEVEVKVEAGAEAGKE
jgi:hypothetical protein